jgi:hypothetical protein
VLAHEAERVFHGQHPHIDCHDVYTAALSYLDADSFRFFGVNMLAPRLMLLIFFVPFVMSIWYIASVTLSPVAASLVPFSLSFGVCHNIRAPRYLVHTLFWRCCHSWIPLSLRCTFPSYSKSRRTNRAHIWCFRARLSLAC